MVGVTDNEIVDRFLVDVMQLQNEIFQLLLSWVRYFAAELKFFCISNLYAISLIKINKTFHKNSFISKIFPLANKSS